MYNPWLSFPSPGVCIPWCYVRVLCVYNIRKCVFNLLNITISGHIYRPFSVASCRYGLLSYCAGQSVLIVCWCCYMSTKIYCAYLVRHGARAADRTPGSHCCCGVHMYTYATPRRNYRMYCICLGRYIETFSFQRKRVVYSPR